MQNRVPVRTVCAWFVVTAGDLYAADILILLAYMQNRLTNSQRYLVNAKPGTNHSTNPTNPNGNSKR